MQQATGELEIDISFLCLLSCWVCLRNENQKHGKKGVEHGRERSLCVLIFLSEMQRDGM